MISNGPKPKNIFDAASELEKARRDKGKQESSPQKTAENPQKTALDDIFRRCHQMHQEIVDSLDSTFKKGGMTHSQLQTFVSRPKNFSERDWKLLEEQKKANQEMLLTLKQKIGVSPEQAQPSKVEPPRSTAERPPQPAAPHQGKRPKIVTKRHWIGM